MMSEISQNTTFVRLNFTLWYLMLIGKVGSVFSSADGDLGSRINFYAKYAREQN